MKERDLIFKKFDGRCAYCGCELQKGWHVDHILPVIRYRKTGWSDHTGKKEVVCSGVIHPERETVDNKIPACASCNINKHSLSVEQFRGMIAQFIESLNKYSVQYKIAKRYGLIKETGAEVKFYFEHLSK